MVKSALFHICHLLCVLVQLHHKNIGNNNHKSHLPITYPTNVHVENKVIKTRITEKSKS